MTRFTESTTRALRTALQAGLAVATSIVAVAIPPVQDAVNAVLQLVGIDYTVTPGLVAALGTLGAALIAIITKVQNRLEGRDDVVTVAQYAEWVTDLTDQLNLLRATIGDVIDEADPDGHIRWHDTADE